MGLSMVQDVVNEYAGTLEIDSAYTDGARIVISLPIQQKAMQNGYGLDTEESDEQ